MLSQVVFVPPPPRPSPRARELATAILRLVGEYQARNGKLNSFELLAALRLVEAELQAGGEAPLRRQRVLILAAVLGLLIAVGLSMVFIFSGDR